MALIGQEHVFKIHFLTNEKVTSQHKDLTRRHKDLTSQHNYLTGDGRSMPPYLKTEILNQLQFTVIVKFLWFYDITSVWAYLANLWNMILPVKYFVFLVTNDLWNQLSYLKEKANIFRTSQIGTLIKTLQKCHKIEFYSNSFRYRFKRQFTFYEMESILVVNRVLSEFPLGYQVKPQTVKRCFVSIHLFRY